MKMKKAMFHHSKQRGITLLESLIAILVMALGILGILGAQMRTLSNTQTSFHRAQAIRLIEDLSERLMTTPNALRNADTYKSPWEAAPKDGKEKNEEEIADCYTQACDNTELAQFDISQWKAKVANTLPSGNASIFFADDETIDTNRRQLGVMVSWRENESSTTNDYLNPLNTSKGSGDGEEKTCPANQTCHLQFIPIVARCAPYFSGSSVQFFCPGS
ncbi:type IV pilus modification protein PilV [Comamonas sp. NoAH]|uniref:type IV pilus modification protein PilV n=1 Tax=Comamonas halotolerans TaxID=3041496 RepID=UPI0024E1336E|nr:type IV pilus modification protein PilV [Comamonas sp. NoAH]